jgi:hypothetical protein
MEDNQISSYLIVNRVEVLTNSSCRACGRGFTSNPMGEKSLVATVADHTHPYYFCGTCGDSLMSRVETEEARKHYIWDWAVPLRDEKQAC